jgi:DNA-binding NarL/FixJ family response regulator
MTGLDAAREIRRSCPKTKVIILSMHAALAYVTQAVRAGASGYVLKESAGAELIEAIRAAMRGEMFFSHKIAEGMAARLAGVADTSAAAAMGRLSDREREVLRFVAGGLSSKTIAQRLGVSPKTVDTYRSRAMVKLGADNLAELVRIAIQAGLLPVEPETG